jgi:hypothetical protein
MVKFHFRTSLYKTTAGRINSDKTGELLCVRHVRALNASLIAASDLFEL